jgi:hypothetical protein
MDPFQTHYFSENLVVSGIEPRTLTTRPQEWSGFISTDPYMTEAELGKRWVGMFCGEIVHVTG